MHKINVFVSSIVVETARLELQIESYFPTECTPKQSTQHLCKPWQLAEGDDKYRVTGKLFSNFYHNAILNFTCNFTIILNFHGPLLSCHVFGLKVGIIGIGG